MDLCPPLPDLTGPEPWTGELRAHLAGCACCRALARLAAAGDGAVTDASPAACDEVALLTAVLAGGGSLAPQQAAVHERHVGSCHRCASAAIAVLLDREALGQLGAGGEAAGDEADAAGWRPAVDPAIGRSLRRRRRTLLATGALVVAAAAAGAVIFASRGDGERANEPVAAPAPPPSPAAPAPRPGDFAALVGDAPALLEAARKAAFEGRYGEALESCEKALELEPDDQDILMTCAVAACKLRVSGKAKTFIARLASETRREMARQICLQEGVDEIDQHPDEEILDDEAPEAAMELDDHLDRAAQAFADQRHGDALAHCQEALVAAPGHQEAVKLCALASCRLKSHELARRYLRDLVGEARRERVREACAEAGISLD